MSIEEKTIWGIHAGKTGEEESLFLDKRVIAVGWVEFGSLDGLKTREDFKEKYAQIYADASVQSVATSAGQLFRFVHEMQVGDLVAYLAKKSRQIHIGTVTGEYEYRPEVNSNYPNQRSVEWLEHLSRTKFSQGALYEMGSALSLFQIKNYADEIYAALKGEKTLVSPQEEAVSMVAEDIEDQTRDFVLKQLERNLKGLPLEEFIKHLLEKMGYRARLMPANEPSVDIIAHKDELGFEPPIIRVQVKSSPDKVSDKDVSALYGKVGYSEFGLLVTLGEFTYPAWQFATGKGNLRLIDGTELVELILEHYDDFDPRYKGIVPLKKVYIPQSLEGEE
jgi:restriction system protein